MPSSTFHKTESRIQHPEGAFSDYVIIHFPAELLRFTDIDQSDPQVKLRDISHFSHFKARVRGENDPLIVSFLQLEEDQPAAKLFPALNLQTEAGENLSSANSLIISNTSTPSEIGTRTPPIPSTTIQSLASQIRL